MATAVDHLGRRAKPYSCAVPADPAATALDVVPRRCPVCGSAGGPAIPANVQEARLDSHSFASRKVPEYMHWRLVACPRCDTLYADPAPPEAALEAAYAGAAYDSGEAARYAAATYAGLLPQLLASTPGGGGALDVGAGDGAFLRELSRAGLDDLAGVEPSGAALAGAPEDLRELIRPGVFRVEDFEAGRFRLITAFQTLEHLSDPLGFCRAAHGLLRDGGALAVVCHDRRAPANRLLGRRSPIFDLEHLQLYSRDSLRVLLERAGFERIELRRIVNRYPLRAWARYLPLPERAKRRVLTALDGPAGGVAIPMPVGNVAAIGYRGRGARSARNT
jgi:SAM-dependent methyltransferase